MLVTHTQPHSTTPAHLQFRFALSFLRLNLIPDFYQIFARPSYSTLHPQFAQPVALGIQAMLKAIPTLMLQSHVAVIRAGGSPSSERVLSALLTPQLALGCASVAFGLAACEAEDFKHRNIIQVTVECYALPFASAPHAWQQSGHRTTTTRACAIKHSQRSLVVCPVVC
jgi:hypothetical protein